MKKQKKSINLKIAAFISLIISQCAIAQQGWFAQSPKPQGSHLSSVCFADENKFWAVGNNGATVTSTDGGNNWNASTINAKANLSRIQFVDEYFGVVCGIEIDYEPVILDEEYGIVLITTDGGLSWIEKFRRSDRLTDVYFADQLNGWAVADSGKVFKTTDGGNNWTKFNCGQDAWLQEVYFSDAFNGWTIGYGQEGGIFKSTNGGETWLNVSPMFENYFHTMSFINSDDGWVCGSEIYRTTDAGATWQQLTSSGGMGSFTDIYFIDENIGLLISYSSFPNPIGLISKSTDGGFTWSIQDQDVFVSSLQLLNNTLGCAVGAWGTIMTTTNGGENWSLISEWLSFSLNKVIFPSLDIGFATARQGSGASATFFVLKSDDGGSSWTISDSASNSWFLDLWFTNESNGWVAGWDYLNNIGIIKNTDDGGNNWIIQYSYPGHGITSINFINSSIGWACVDGNGGELIHTTDGGSNWNLISTGYSFNPSKIFFINIAIGFAIGYSSNAARIIKTTDGGQTWQDFSPQNLPDVLYDIDFVNEQTGWVVGEHGIVLKTSNGGATWNQIWPDPWPLGPGFNSVQFVSENIGWIVTGDIFASPGSSSIFYTTNGGDNWELQAFLEGTKGSIFFYDQNTGWFVGGRNIYGDPTIGFVHKTLTGGTTFVEDNNPINQIPESHILFQNFPNPFNPSTKISWQVPVGSWQTLKIYDVLGNEVATLVDEYKPVGSYEVEWDASDLPSGIYFYQLKTENFIETKKMILIK